MRTVEKVGSGVCKRCYGEVKGQLIEGEKVTDSGLADVMYFEDFCEKSCRDAYRVVILQKMTTLAEGALFGVVYPILGGTHVRMSESGVPLTNEELAQYIDDEVREKYYTYWEENMKASYSKLGYSYDLLDWVGEWEQPPGVNNGSTEIRCQV